MDVGSYQCYGIRDRSGALLRYAQYFCHDVSPSFCSILLSVLIEHFLYVQPKSLKPVWLPIYHRPCWSGVFMTQSWTLDGLYVCAFICPMTGYLWIKNSPSAVLLRMGQLVSGGTLLLLAFSTPEHCLIRGGCSMYHTKQRMERKQALRYLCQRSQCWKFWQWKRWRIRLRHILEEVKMVAWNGWITF